ncbi:MAG: DnaJ domain-containing protein [Gammaproteobacteria bacterium]|nr:DnaJ domain-containing protein [Gammaproteobacteria bacterium]
MQNKTSDIPEEFIFALQKELEKKPDGIGEYELIQNLKVLGYFDFLSSPAMPHELFQAHFFLFHTLYLLRDIFLEKQQYVLNINTLKIELLPYQQGEYTLEQEDKVRSYYLDLKNLEETSEDDVYDMLASFWNKFNSFDRRETALAELGLKDPVDNKTIKQKYRKLVMQHHPDRGGDKDKLQKINDALASLVD